MERMEAKNLRFTQTQIAKLEEMSKERGIKISELMRRALDEFLDKWEAARKSK